MAENQKRKLKFYYYATFFKKTKHKKNNDFGINCIKPNKENSDKNLKSRSSLKPSVIPKLSFNFSVVEPLTSCRQFSYNKNVHIPRK